jgi:Glycosyl transferase family 2
MTPSLKKWFDEAEYETTDEHMSLALDPLVVDALPTVSIITVVRDRPEFVGLMLYNWNHIHYPRNKLEWVIIDDSKDRKLERYLPLKNQTKTDSDGSKIVYKYFDVPFDSLAAKRNYGASVASGVILAHYDSDDYYPGDSLMAKVRILLKYPAKDFVFSWPIGVYNIYNGKSYVYGSNYVLMRIPEASLAYKKTYWEFNHFDTPDNALESESTSFIRDHTRNGIKVQFMFNVVVLAHSTNLMPQLRQDQATDGNIWCHEMVSIAQTLSPELLYVIENIKEFQGGLPRPHGGG